MKPSGITAAIYIHQYSAVAGVHVKPSGWYKNSPTSPLFSMVQELCESGGGRPGLSVLTSLLVSVDVKIY